jgi:hypothetical protein
MKGVTECFKVNVLKFVLYDQRITTHRKKEMFNHVHRIIRVPAQELVQLVRKVNAKHIRPFTCKKRVVHLSATFMLLYDGNVVKFL